MRLHNYENLQIWKEGLDLVDKVYEYAEELPDKEKYGLWSQLTRAAVSIPSNIAEGAARSTNKAFSQFLRISMGSAFEIQTQLEICKRRNYGDLLKLDILNEQLRIQQRKMIKFHDQLSENK